jgi:hypothetical protein
VVITWLFVFIGIQPVLWQFGGFQSGVMAVWCISVGSYGSLVVFRRVLWQFVGFQLGVVAV